MQPCAQVDLLRRRQVAFEGRALDAVRGGQALEDPAASVVDQYDGRRAAARGE